jgi:tetratricopeptide (TPR) repeat protein
VTGQSCSNATCKRAKARRAAKASTWPSRDLVAQEPGFSRAHSLLCAALVVYGDLGLAKSPDARDTVAAEGEREARRALSLDPNNGDADQCLATLTPWDSYAKQEALLQKGLAVEPNNGHLHTAYSYLLQATGRDQDALAQSEQAYADAPYERGAYDDLGLALMAVGQDAAAAAKMAEARRLWPKDVLAWVNELRIATWRSPPDTRLTLASFGDPLWSAGAPEARDIWRNVWESLQAGDAAQKAAAASLVMKNTQNGKINSLDGVAALLVLGDLDDEFALANQTATPQRVHTPDGFEPLDFMFIQFAPVGAAARRDPRFMPLMAKLGLVDYWRTSGHWPDFCAEPGLPYDCKAEAAKLASARP